MPVSVPADGAAHPHPDRSARHGRIDPDRAGMIGAARMEAAERCHPNDAGGAISP